MANRAWVRLHSRPRRLPDGEILWDGVLIDITELKKVEEEVKSLNASLERRVAERTAEVDSMLANATVGLAFADRELRCIRINQYLADIDGLPIEEHLGQTLHDLVPQVAKSIESDLQEVFATGRPVSGREIALERPARPHEKRHLVLGHYPVFSADGSVFSVGTSVTDITDRKRSEEALAELNRALRAEIAQRRTGRNPDAEACHRRGGYPGLCGHRRRRETDPLPEPGLLRGPGALARS